MTFKSRPSWHHDAATKERIAEARRQHFATIGKEEYDAWRDRISVGVRETVENMSDEERERKFGGRNEAKRQYYVDHPEVAERIGRKMSEVRNSLSSEEQEQWAKNAAEAHRESPLWEVSYDETWRQRISESVQLLWTDEKRREQSKRAIEQWIQGRWGEKVLGHTQNVYPSNWEFIKMVIRERDGNACRLCGSNSALHVHHINYDPTDCRWENLITLCDSHHARTNFDRAYWQGFLLEKVLGEGEEILV